MNETQRQFTTKILWASTIYFLLCGASALLYPKIWLLLSGLPSTVSTELNLAFGVAAAYLLAMACGSAISALAPSKNSGLILTLSIANLLDFSITLKAVAAQQLPILNGGLFLVIAATWATLIGVAYTYVKRANPV
jgi:hypothetical protein